MSKESRVIVQKMVLKELRGLRNDLIEGGTPSRHITKLNQQIAILDLQLGNDHE